MNACKSLVTELVMLKVRAAAFSAAAGSLGLLKGLEIGTRVPGAMNDVLDLPVQADFVDSLKRLWNIWPHHSLRWICL